MMEWEARIVPFDLEGRRLEMIFTTASLLAVEERFGGLETLGERMEKEALKTSIWLAEEMANQGIMLRAGKTHLSCEERVTLGWLAQYLPPYRIKELSRATMDAIRIGMSAETVKTDEDAEVDVVLEEIEKNAGGAGTLRPCALYRAG